MAHWLRDVIGTPKELHGVESADAYIAKAKAFLVRHGQKPSIREVAERPDAYISDGRWVCRCACGNGCAAHPEWEIAVCFECGTLYRPVFPDGRQLAEAVLLARPHSHNRHYFPTDETARIHGIPKRETVLGLARENRARGLPVRPASVNQDGDV